MTSFVRLLVVAAIAACEPRPTVAVEIAPLPTPPPTAVVVVAPAKPVVQTPNIGGERDPRRAQPRARALLITELQGLESLLMATSQASPDRVQLRRRLAEDYVELRRSGGANASQKAIDEYQALVREYPNYPLLDEVLYYLGLEHEVLGDYASARRTYFDVIAKWPSSRFVPYAYFAFGELFFQEAQGDPSKWTIALEAYRKVLSYAGSPLAPEAAYKMIITYKAMGDEPHAAEMHRRLVNDFPSSPAASRMTP